MTRIAKHSSQNLILIRGISIKAYFLVIFGGVFNIAVEDIDLQQVGFGVFVLYPHCTHC